MQKRLFVYDLHDDTGPAGHHQPGDRESDGEWAYEEGCLSVPGLSWEIVRPEARSTSSGSTSTATRSRIEADELLARMFQHELDHLDGVLLSSASTRTSARQAKKASPRAACSGRAAEPAPRRSRRCAAARLTAEPSPPPPRRPPRGSSSSARRSWRSRRCGPWSTPASTSRSWCHRRRQAAGPRQRRRRRRPVKAAALELGLPVTDDLDDVARRRRRPRRGGGLRPDHPAARARRSCRWSTSTSRCCRAGGARRRSSGRILAGDDAHRRRPDGGGGGPRHRRHLRRAEVPIGADETARRAARPAGRRRHPAPGRHARAPGSARPRRRWASRPTPPRSTRPSCELDWSRPAVELAPARPARRRVDDVPRAGGSRCWRDRTCRPAGDGAAVVPAGDGDASSCVEVQPEGKGRMAADGLGQRRPLGARRPAAARERRADRPRRPCAARRARPHRRRTAPTPTSLLPELLERSGLDAARPRTSSPSSSTAPPACAGPATASSTASSLGDLDPPVRAALRLGAYQLHFLGTPPHAAVRRDRRGRAPKAARASSTPCSARWPTTAVAWPDDATRLSYPDWIVERCAADLGARRRASPRSRSMNDAADGHRARRRLRPGPGLAVGGRGGRRRGRASGCSTCAPPRAARPRRWPAPAPASSPPTSGRRGSAWSPPTPAASAPPVAVVVADGARARRSRPASFDRVLVDAPCSGLGVAPPPARRPLAHRRRRRRAPRRAPAGAARRRGRRSCARAACSSTRCARSPTPRRTGVDRAPRRPPTPSWPPLDAAGRAVAALGDAARCLLPQAADTDGMSLFRWRRPTPS